MSNTAHRNSHRQPVRKHVRDIACLCRRKNSPSVDRCPSAVGKCTCKRYSAATRESHRSNVARLVLEVFAYRYVVAVRVYCRAIRTDIDVKTAVSREKVCFVGVRLERAAVDSDGSPAAGVVQIYLRCRKNAASCYIDSRALRIRIVI